MHSHRSMRHVAEHLVSSLQISSDDRIGAVDSFTYAGVTGTTRAALIGWGSHQLLQPQGPWPCRLRSVAARLRHLLHAHANRCASYTQRIRRSSPRHATSDRFCGRGGDLRAGCPRVPIGLPRESPIRVSLLRPRRPTTSLGGCSFPATRSKTAQSVTTTSGLASSLQVPTENRSPMARSVRSCAQTNTIGIGYYGEPEITAKSFDLPSEGLRTFRTGDLGRVRSGWCTRALRTQRHPREDPAASTSNSSQWKTCSSRIRRLPTAR